MQDQVSSEVAVTQQDDFSTADWVQGEDGRWVLTQESKDRSTALYYSGRLAYSKEDTSKTIGRYNSVGEVIPFKTWAQE